MHKHTTFRVGGPAEVFVTVENSKQLEKIIKYLNLVERPYFILGNGSNLLVGDKGYRGVIIRLGGDFNHLTVEGTLLTAGASVLLSAAAYGKRPGRNGICLRHTGKRGRRRQDERRGL